MIRTLELPDDVYRDLIEAAEAEGLPPAAWIRSHISAHPAGSARPVISRDEAMARLLRHTVSLGYPTGTDNEQIDADLAREYGETHEERR